jgi:hypothetical protein
MSKRFLIVFLGIVIVSLASFIVLPDAALTDQIYLSICFATFLSQITALVFFLTSLRVFKQKLRTAYKVLSAGIFLFSLPAFILPVASMVEMDPLILSTYVVGSSLLGALVMYTALRRFASLLTIRTLFTSTLFAIIVAALLGAISTLLPHLESPYEEYIVDAIFAGYIIAGTFSAISATVALQIRNKLGKLYKNSMGWLAGALFIAAFACLHETLTKLLPVFSEPIFSDYFVSVSLWPFLLTAALLLQASISFRHISARVLDIPAKATPIQVVSYVARMASDPSAIDVILDKVREISALQNPKSNLSATEQAKIIAAYREIETYLTTKEPLRRYTVEDIRSLLPEQFRHLLTS